ncbi:MAG TPA: response regulator [Spirochaetota bacterium]|nr:response regulator [Spirochaetota bacterium]HPC41990.1 response regulator [Spirochaetota bacterium]HPL17250.1 response regulator [Spirochaetota bacterium]HQJ71167.1 response regulator [Spirochaetota bacterium]HRS77445.1 response regulator [Spirochaetota bacterium]
MGKKLADLFLGKYRNADYVLQQKSKLILSVSFVIIAVFIVLILTNIVRNNTSAEVLSPLVSGLIFLFAALYLLRSGRFTLSAHLVLCICLAAVWGALFFDINTESAIVLDTIVYAIGLMVLTPIVVTRHKTGIVVYCAVNVVIFIIFSLRAKDLYHLSVFAFTDYLIDNMIAFVFIGIMSYHIFRINDRALRLAEEEMEKNRDLAQHLEEMVHDRTEELQEANDKLKEMDRIKSNFFANISHEIRTPLTMILAPVESALQGDQGVTIDRNLLLTVERNASRLLNLVNNLLDLARLDAGRMPMAVARQDMVAFVRSYIDTVRSAFETRHLDLKVVSSRDSITVYFDPEKMDKIFMNLFSNAFKYTEPGGSITVRVIDDDRACYIEFEDTGAGIPRDNLDIIFDRFGQAHAGAHRRGEGSGIGLSLVRELVQLHGGTVSVESVYAGDNPADHGTVFTIMLPKGTAQWKYFPGIQYLEPGEKGGPLFPQRAVETRFLSEAKETMPGPAATPARPEVSLLVVEDNADMRKYLTTLLERRYSVRCAENGREGLAAATAKRPDLVITDVMMPVMNGYEMTRRLREDDALKQIPVIMLTARVESSDLDDGQVNMADDYITKPFNGQELLSRIEALLSRRK